VTRLHCAEAWFSAHESRVGQAFSEKVQGHCLQRPGKYTASGTRKHWSQQARRLSREMACLCARLGLGISHQQLLHPLAAKDLSTAEG